MVPIGTSSDSDLHLHGRNGYFAGSPAIHRHSIEIEDISGFEAKTMVEHRSRADLHRILLPGFSGHNNFLPMEHRQLQQGSGRYPRLVDVFDFPPTQLPRRAPLSHRLPLLCVPRDFPLLRGHRGVLLFWHQRRGAEVLEESLAR